MQTILIVDDNSELRRLLKMTLDPSHRNIHEAVNPTDALELARNVRPDIVLLDVMMPGGNGFDLCKKLKSDPLTEHCFVALITARGQASDIALGLSSGADAYLLKPFSPSRLLDLVEQPAAYKNFGFQDTD